MTGGAVHVGGDVALALSRLHDCLIRGADSLAAEAGLAMIGERITAHLVPVRASGRVTGGSR